MFKLRPLTRGDPRADPPLYFQGRLHPPQAVLLHKMQAMEQRPVLDNAYGPGTAMQFNAGRLSAHFGFGKTVTVIALIGGPPPLRCTPMANMVSLPHNNFANLTVVASNHEDAAKEMGAVVGRSTHPASFSSWATQTLPYAKWLPERFLPSTLVITATSVISQWQDNMDQFLPHLNYLIIDKVSGLRTFQSLLASGSFTEYDIVLIKCGKVTKSFQVAGETCGSGSRSILQALNAVTEGRIWDRVVIDDYDSIEMVAQDCLPPAFFTWYISATHRTSLITVREPTPQAGGFEKGIEHAGRFFVDHSLPAVAPGQWPVLAACHDSLLHSTLSVTCTDDFLAETYTLPRPVYTNYIVACDPALRLLRGMVGLNPAALEALNGGAVATAAACLGVSCQTPGGILRRVLSDHLAKYAQACSVLALIEGVREQLRQNTGPPMDAPTAKRLVSRIHESIIIPSQPLPTAAVLVEQLALSSLSHSVPFDTATKKMRERFGAARETSGRSLDRLRSNVREQQCQVCLLEWDDEELEGQMRYILNCCQLVVCQTCIVRPRGTGGAVEFVRFCPMCSRGVKAQSIIGVGEEIDLDVMFGSEGEETGSDLDETVVGEFRLGEYQKEAAASKPVDVLVFDTFRCAKLRALVQLLVGLPVAVRTPMYSGAPILGLMGGNGELVEGPAEAQLQCLVFALHAESTHLISQALSLAKLPHQILKGTRAQKDSIVAKFKKPVTVFKSGEKAIPRIMLITASRDCAGLHLPQCTDLIFYHQIRDPAVEQQVAGRGQRQGRSSSLRIHRLLFAHEEPEQGQ